MAHGKAHEKQQEATAERGAGFQVSIARLDKVLLLNQGFDVYFNALLIAPWQERCWGELRPNEKAKGNEVHSACTCAKNTPAVFGKEEARVWGVLGFSVLALMAQTSAACLRSSLNFFFQGRFPCSIHPQQTKSLPARSPKWIVHIMGVQFVKSKCLHLPIFLIIPCCFVYLLRLVYLFNNNSILERKHHVKAKARMFEENKKANVSSFAPEVFAEYHLIHRKLQICWNCCCSIWGFYKKYNLAFTESNFPLWDWLYCEMDSKMTCYQQASMPWTTSFS